MKRPFLALSALSLCFMSSSAWSIENQGNQLKDKKDKVSYSIGVDVGRSIQKQKIEINPEMFLMGIKDGQANKTTMMSDEDIRQTLLGLQTEMLEKQKTEMKEAAAKNLADGQKFLTQNKKTKGIITLPSGLQYRILTEGTGEPPKATDIVTTHYRGRLIDGTEFDSSYNRGEPVKFAVNGVIPGWTEALQLMKPGAKWELFIPPQLAYGEHGVGQIIGPNSTLIFDVELLKVEKPENQQNNAQGKPNQSTNSTKKDKAKS